MPSYRGLGSRRIVAVPDPTGNNTGNLTTVIDAATIGINVPEFELYKVALEDVPPGSQARCYLGARAWSFTYPNGGSEWDPQQPLLIQPGQDLYFYWNIPATSKVVPVATPWFRYDSIQWSNQ